MSFGKRSSGFQITSVASDVSQSQAGLFTPSLVLNLLQSDSCLQGSSSQPNSPSLKRKYSSHDAPGSRFRVVRLAVGSASGGVRDESYHRGRWKCLDLKERQEGTGFRQVMDSMRHAHSLESLEMIGCNRLKGRVLSQETAHLSAHQKSGLEGTGLILDSGPPSPNHQDPVHVRALDCMEPMTAQGLQANPPPPPRPRHAPPPLCLDVDPAGRSILRLSRSQASSPSAGPHHPTGTPIQIPAAFSLDQTIFSLPGGNSGSCNSLLSIDTKVEQAMDLVKNHLMLAVREEVELLRERIRELQEKNQELERENHILRALTHNMTTQHNRRERTTS
ncbi:TSC22 domain family protein 4-like [Salarias fasciatus]|uniref:TSC22 domain family protein 4-like n=1 Tax=Salarias fasciatus TaxID=181472 RepID=A0A672FTU0_SALFA|nr:TSC22 domain family protein 4-like [Salarias fasciatus]XP_029943294.1 TSC22 domain family protein 4-like [Salarias fasciatus]